MGHGDTPYPNLLIVVGASAGGLEPIKTIVDSFPGRLRATVIVATHRDPNIEGNILADILSRDTRVTVREPVGGEQLRCTTVYIGKPNESVSVEGQDLRIDEITGRVESLSRIDNLFRSAAASAGKNAIGVILSGTLSDGVAGLRAIHDAGGTCIAQSPDHAAFKDMPRNAIENVAVDFVGTAEEIGFHLVGLADERACR